MNSSKSSRAGLAWLLVLTLAGCDEGASKGDAPDGPSKRGDRDAPKWKVDYSGDLSGHIEGKSLVIVKTGPAAHTNFAVKTMGKKPGLTATLSIHDDQPSGFLTQVTLEDGTKCKPTGHSNVKILDADKKTFHATIDGKLKCGEAEDQILDFEAVLEER
jgi:hypothetical protein